MLELTWLIVVSGGLAGWAWWDAREYRSFQTLTDTGIRQHYLKLWTLQSFFIFTGASVATLAIVGHTVVPMGLPAEFAPLADMVSSTREAPTESTSGRLGLIMGIAVGVSAAVFIQWYRAKKLLTPVVGDVEALLPRNGRERLLMLPLSLNAGFSEELFFRLAFPLLITNVTGSAMVGVVAATVVFGLVHAYQGWKGVLATGLVGTLLMLQFLAHGSLLLVMAIHAAIDIVSLIIRPMITDRLAAHRRNKTQAV